MTQQLELFPIELDVDGVIDEKTGVQMIGKARQQPNGLWNVLANVGGALCVVEVRITPQPRIQP